MGIKLNAVHLLSTTIPHLADLSDRKILTFGVQDCYFTYDQLVNFLRRHNIAHRAVSQDKIRLSVASTHVTAANRRYYPDFERHVHQNTLFETLGASPDNIHSMDASSHEGADIIHDLNEPVDVARHCTYDLIFDGGTIEHVFSIKDALYNTANMCRVGGIVVHFAPVDLINHGFVNVNAELFQDFYSSNGFEELTSKYVLMPIHPWRADDHYLEYQPDKLWITMRPYYHMGLYSAYRKVEHRGLTVPQQGTYRRSWSGESDVPERNGLPARMRQWLVDWIDTHLVAATLVRWGRVLRRGKKIVL